MYRALGGPHARSGLLMDRASLRRDFWDAERQLTRFLGDEHISFLLRQLRVNCVIDVGANTGQYARMIRQLGYHGTDRLLRARRGPWSSCGRSAPATPTGSSTRWRSATRTPPPRSSRPRARPSAPSCRPPTSARTSTRSWPIRCASRWTYAAWTASSTRSSRASPSRASSSRWTPRASTCRPSAGRRPRLEEILAMQSEVALVPALRRHATPPRAARGVRSPRLRGRRDVPGVAATCRPCGSSSST